jgi:hypothetical protein
VNFNIVFKTITCAFVGGKNVDNKTISLFCQSHNNSIRYWYITMATYFGVSLDHLQANVRR